MRGLSRGVRWLLRRHHPVVDTPFAFEQGGDHGTPVRPRRAAHQRRREGQRVLPEALQWKVQDVPMPGGNTYTMIDVGGAPGRHHEESQPGAPSFWLACT